jgi:hypothetical protein
MSAFTPTLLTALILAAGALMVLLPNAARPGSGLDRRAQRALHALARRHAALMRWLAVAFRYPELGGYVHDTAMTQYLPPTIFHYVTGTWTHSAGQVADTIAVKNAAADAATTLNIPITIPSNSVGQKGAYLKSVEIDFEILTAACDAVSAVFNVVTRGADGADAAVSAQSFTYDSGHDDAAERIDVDEHRMTLTLDTPVWLDNDQYALVELTLDRAATTVVEMLGAFANYTLRL